MGKKQHQSDKLYITNTEWREFYGGKNTTRTDSKDTSDFRRLPLNHCALSLQVQCTIIHVLYITFFVPYKRAGTHPAKRQYTPPSKKSQKSLVENQHSYNWWSKNQVKKRFMPGYTGILSPRTYLSSSLLLQLSDSLFKPTYHT